MCLIISALHATTTALYTQALKRTTSHDSLRQAMHTKPTKLTTSVPGSMDPEAVFNSDGIARGRGLSSSDTMSSAHKTARLFDTDPMVTRVSADARSSVHDSHRAGLVSTGTSFNWNQAWDEE